MQYMSENALTIQDRLLEIEESTIMPFDDIADAMEALDYLSLLNDETKEKLIGLCLDKKLLEDFNEEGETLYDEDEMGDDLDEEMEIEEAND